MGNGHHVPILCLPWALCIPQQRSRKAPKQGQYDALEASDVHSPAEFSQFTDDKAAVAASCEYYIHFSVNLEKLRNKQVFISILGRSKAGRSPPPTTAYAFKAGTQLPRITRLPLLPSKLHTSTYRWRAAIVSVILSRQSHSQASSPCQIGKNREGRCKMSLVLRDSHLWKKRMERRKERCSVGRPGKGTSKKKNVRQGAI